MFTREKGITPVIAIVLLLLITVGAVGVVYTQFQDITSGDDAQEELQSQQRIQSSSYNIIGVSKAGSSPGTFDITVKNTADDTTLNISRQATMQIGKSGANPQAVSVVSPSGSDCEWTEDSPKPGESATCETDVEWVSPSEYNDGQLEEVNFLVQEVTKDSYSCDAAADFC